MTKTKRPVRFFNTTGPCNPWDHYMLPPEDRLVGAQLPRYIKDSLYWVLHAPRQTGKTTFLQSWMREINSGDEAIACYTSVEACQGIPERTEAMKTMHFSICESARASGLPIPELPMDNPELLLYQTMQRWSELIAPKPLVILFDEVDVLEGEALISFLRQLRSGFASRGVGKFPVSIALVGMRDLKDYITAAKDGVAPNPGSPFNIKADSAVLSNFSQADIERLFAQRTEETEEQKMNYTEAFPHLLLMAFLQRVLNGGGHIDREYAAGRGRMDLAVEYKNKIYIIEIKLIHPYDSPSEVHAEGLEQIKKNRDKIDTSSPAYLVIFDRRPEIKEKSWDERLSWNSKDGITIIDC